MRYLHERPTYLSETKVATGTPIKRLPCPVNLIGKYLRSLCGRLAVSFHFIFWVRKKLTINSVETFLSLPLIDIIRQSELSARHTCTSYWQKLTSYRQTDMHEAKIRHFKHCHHFSSKLWHKLMPHTVLPEGFEQRRFFFGHFINCVAIFRLAQTSLSLKKKR